MTPGPNVEVDHLTTEVIADGYHHAPEMLQFAYCMNVPPRTMWPFVFPRGPVGSSSGACR